MDGLICLENLYERPLFLPRLKRSILDQKANQNLHMKKI